MIQLMDARLRGRVGTVFADGLRALRQIKGARPMSQGLLEGLPSAWHEWVARHAGDGCLGMGFMVPDGPPARGVNPRYDLFVTGGRLAEQVVYLTGTAFKPPQERGRRSRARQQPDAARADSLTDAVLGDNPLLALQGMSRYQIARAMEKLLREPKVATINTLCHYLIDHPEDQVAAAAALKASSYDAVQDLIDTLGDFAPGAMEAAVFLLGELGDILGYKPIDDLHLWDRGIFAEALAKIELHNARSDDREQARLGLSDTCPSWRLPEPQAPEKDTLAWPLWDVEALVDRFEQDDQPWWAFWREGVDIKPWATLELKKGEEVAVKKGGRQLFRVLARTMPSLQTVRVECSEPLAGVLVRLVASDYRSAEVLEVGTLVQRGASWSALDEERRRDVLYLSPADAAEALPAIAQFAQPRYAHQS